MVKGKSETTATAAIGQKSVGATVATLAVIRVACRASAGFRLADVVRSTGLNRSTAFNILRTLAQEGILAFDPEGKAYALTDYLPRLIRGIDDEPGDRDRALHEGMARIAELFGVTIAHWIVRGTSLVLKAVASSGAEFALTQTEGRIAPILHGAAGRAVVAEMDLPDEALARLLAEAGAVPESLASVKTDLARARERGWADDGGSLQPGVEAVAVALRDAEGRVDGACAALMLSGQFDARNQEAVAIALTRIAG